MTESNTVDGIPLVSELTAARLDDRQQIDYRAHRRRFVGWLLAFGKGPETGEALRSQMPRRGSELYREQYLWRSPF